MCSHTVDAGTISVYIDSSPNVLRATPWYPHGLLPDPPHADASVWRQLAQTSDLRIAGCLAFPVTLYCFLAARLGGVAAAQRGISGFQNSLLDLVTSVEESIVLPPSKRPNAFSPRDWHAPRPPV